LHISGFNAQLNYTVLW